MSDATFGLILALSPVIVTFVVFILPMIYSIIISFSSYDHMQGSISKLVGFKNYMIILNDRAFWNAWLVTLKHILICVPTELILGVLVALLMNGQVFGRRLWRTTILAPMMVTPVVAGLIWKLIYQPGNSILNYVLSVIGLPTWTWNNGPGAIFAIAITDIWLSTPFIILICLATLQGIPDELYEAAEVDGARALDKFFFITFPYLQNVLLIGALFKTIDTTKTFDTIYTLTNGAYNTTNTMIFFYSRLFQTFQIDRASAFAVIMILMTSIITLPIIRKLLSDVGKVRD